MPAWVKNVLDQWLQATTITSGKLSSCAQNGRGVGRETDGKSCVARGSGVCHESRYRQVSAARPPPTCARLCHTAGANCSRSSFYSVTFPFRQPNDISVANSAFKVPSTKKSE